MWSAGTRSQLAVPNNNHGSPHRTSKCLQDPTNLLRTSEQSGPLTLSLCGLRYPPEKTKIDLINRREKGLFRLLSADCSQCQKKFLTTVDSHQLEYSKVLHTCLLKDHGMIFFFFLSGPKNSLSKNIFCLFQSDWVPFFLKAALITPWGFPYPSHLWMD